ncbi:CobQ/CobB/MinD/ParA nucleotide binding domain protein [Teredinibacter turnerae T7901]|uniref:CobQ/CobB/MinD/ParA nucleotide binding domain protein n=1 Tax=Teredinibacter turnerae (strain ATCC 39867 / T7901) TaxID=377629 RepID=C5BSI2_TERTT|nr:ParA family protein [Teredinibacter turnerae]ACR12213.1 CobQ/CobB/MinD/ParA nucleotide binding domain protein [Teredinibacter turnerae T7901]
MQVWTVANQKGGVGKTTTSVALGGLAAEAGLRVLLVDIDPQGSLSCYFRQNPDEIRDSAFTLFDNATAINHNLVEKIILPTPFANLHLLPASTALATLERKAVGGGMGLVLSRSLAAVASEYDLAIIDCPPQLGVLMINAIAACSQLIIPVQTEFLAIKGLERILHTLNMMGKSRKQALLYHILPTMYDRRTQASVTSLRTIRNKYGEQVWAGKIPIDTRFRDASKAGLPPHLFDANSRGVIAYRSLLQFLNTANARQLQQAGMQ